jgi:hypothetical protein
MVKTSIYFKSPELFKNPDNQALSLKAMRSILMGALELIRKTPIGFREMTAKGLQISESID